MKSVPVRTAFPNCEECSKFHLKITVHYNADDENYDYYCEHIEICRNAIEIYKQQKVKRVNGEEVPVEI